MSRLLEAVVDSLLLELGGTYPAWKIAIWLCLTD